MVLAAGSLINNLIGLWWVAVSASLAAGFTLVGAWRGVSQHRLPRMMLGIAVLGIALSYWWDIFGSDGVGAEMRRGASYVLWPALLWTAWSGIAYSRRRDSVVNMIMKGDPE